MECVVMVVGPLGVIMVAVVDPAPTCAPWTGQEAPVQVVGE